MSIANTKKSKHPASKKTLFFDKNRHFPALRTISSKHPASTWLFRDSPITPVNEWLDCRLPETLCQLPIFVSFPIIRTVHN